MSLLIALLASSAMPQTKSGFTYKGVSYGERQLLVCDWFSNFENSRFESCRTDSGATVAIEEGASIDCLGQSCQELDVKARRVARWKKPEPVWGNFTVRFYGRVSAGQRAKKYLGDGTRTVLIENLISVQKR